MVNVKFERVSDTLPENIKKIINSEPNFKREFLIRAANEFLQTIRFLAPRDTGKYANSWAITKVESNYVEVSTPKGKLAVFLEYGTAPHPIFPKRKKALHWVDQDGEHFALYVRHPGTHPAPHIRPTINVLEAKIPELALNVLQKYFKPV